MTNSAAKKSDHWDIDSLAKYVSEIVEKESGNNLGDTQQSMVISRLKKRMIDLDNISSNNYYNYLKENYAIESTHLVTILTTHHTFFFREFCHFEYLQMNLHEIVKHVKDRGNSKIRILSAACSRGQEAYSLAMFFEKNLTDYPGMTYEIVGTDIDPESINVSKNGVYLYKDVKSIPQMYVNGNWQKGQGEIAHYAKLKSNIKEKCSFHTMNLLDMHSILAGQKFDIIFCRNVFIYFDNEKILKVCKDFNKYIHKGGLLITGLSESLKSIDFKKQTLAPSVYCPNPFEQAPSADKSAATSNVTPISKAITPKSSIKYPIRVLAVDDSTSILKLLTRIFKSDPQFELVGTAANGIEAQDFLKKNTVDVMTLDIHMPGMDGVEYLKKNFSSTHPKVVVVSSASREDARYAQKTIEYGACDFVEKPTLNNLSATAEEIKNKLKMSLLSSEAFSENSLDKEFKKDYSISSCENKARIIFGHLSDLKKISFIMKELQGGQPPIFLFFEGNGNFLDITFQKLQKEGISKSEIYTEYTKLEKDHIYICDFKSHFDCVYEKLKTVHISCGILGLSTNETIKKIQLFKNSQILAEDTEQLSSELKLIATDIFPWTSFSHVGTEYLTKDKNKDK